MEDFSKQVYLTTTQAIDFLDEFPQYSHYLMETANGYSFTEEAIKEFNGALEDEKKALSELVNPTNSVTNSMTTLFNLYIIKANSKFNKAH